MKDYLYLFNPFRNPCLPNWIWFEYQRATKPGYWDQDVIAVYYLWRFEKPRRRHKCTVQWSVEEWTIAEILQQVGAYLHPDFDLGQANYFVERGLPLGEFSTPLVLMENPPPPKRQTNRTLLGSKEHA